jgi:hypothetical protein
LPFSASRISAWKPGRSSVAPEIAWSEYSLAMCPALALRELAADAELVRDRGLALVL